MSRRFSFDPLKPLTASIGVGVITFCLYLTTISPSWGFVDGGELSAVGSRLGIAHPTGYPTTILLARAAVLLSPARDVVTLNILAALLISLSVALLFLLSLDVLRLVQGLKSGQKLPRSTIGVALIASLLTGTGVVWWSQATSFEVYALHLAVSLFAARLFLRFVEHEKGEKPEWRTRQGTLFGIVLGLAFTTHLTMLFWLPAFIVYYFGSLGLSSRSFRRLLPLIPGVALGLLPYLYLPICALTNPALNWGDPDSPLRFLDHVTGAAFRDKMVLDSDVFSAQTGWFFSTLPGDFIWGGLLFALIGLVTLFMRRRLLAAWSLSVFAVTLLLSGCYAILDVEPYYLPAIAMVGLWCAVGLETLRQKIRAAETIAVGIILVCVNTYLNFNDADKSSDRYSEQMTLNMLNTLPRNAVIFSDDWDFWVSGSLYAQQVDKVRPDVQVIYVTLLQYEWYRQELMGRAPELMRGLEGVSDEYAHALDAFLDDGKNGEALRGLLIRTVDGIIENAMKEGRGKRPVFVSGGIDPGMGSRYERAPNFLALQLMPPGEYLPQKFPSYDVTFTITRIDPYIAMIHEMYARSFIARGIYEEQYGHIDEAGRYYHAAFAFDPEYLIEDVPDFPLNGEEQINATEQFFREMREMTKGRLK